MVVVVILIIIITSTIIIITIIITVIIIMTISNRYYYYCYFLSFIIIFYNNFRYSCHHTDMTSYQISTLNFLCISVDSHIHIYHMHPPLQKKKVFLWDHKGNKTTQLFCVILAIATRIFFYLLFYLTVQFLIVNLFEKAT